MKILLVDEGGFEEFISGEQYRHETFENPPCPSYSSENGNLSKRASFEIVWDDNDTFKDYETVSSYKDNFKIIYGRVNGETKPISVQVRSLQF